MFTLTTTETKKPPNPQVEDPASGGEAPTTKKILLKKHPRKITTMLNPNTTETRIKKFQSIFLINIFT